MLTNCNTWRMRNVLLIGRQLKVGGQFTGEWEGEMPDGSCHSVNGNLNYSSFSFFFYDFHFFFNFARPLRP